MIGQGLEDSANQLKGTVEELTNKNTSTPISPLTKEQFQKFLMGIAFPLNNLSMEINAMKSEDSPAAVNLMIMIFNGYQTITAKIADGLIWIYLKMSTIFFSTDDTSSFGAGVFVLLKSLIFLSFTIILLVSVFRGQSSSGGGFGQMIEQTIATYRSDGAGTIGSGILDSGTLTPAQAGLRFIFLVMLFFFVTTITPVISLSDPESPLSKVAHSAANASIFPDDLTNPTVQAAIENSPKIGFVPKHIEFIVRLGTSIQASIESLTMSGILSFMEAQISQAASTVTPANIKQVNNILGFNAGVVATEYGLSSDSYYKDSQYNSALLNGALQAAYRHVNGYGGWQHAFEAFPVIEASTYDDGEPIAFYDRNGVPEAMSFLTAGTKSMGGSNNVQDNLIFSSIEASDISPDKRWLSLEKANAFSSRTSGELAKYVLGYEYYKNISTANISLNDFGKYMGWKTDTGALPLRSNSALFTNNYGITTPPFRPPLTITVERVGGHPGSKLSLATAYDHVRKTPHLLASMYNSPRNGVPKEEYNLYATYLQPLLFSYLDVERAAFSGPRYGLTELGPLNEYEEMALNPIINYFYSGVSNLSDYPSLTSMIPALRLTATELDGWRNEKTISSSDFSVYTFRERANHLLRNGILGVRSLFEMSGNPAAAESRMIDALSKLPPSGIARFAGYYVPSLFYLPPEEGSASSSTASSSPVDGVSAPVGHRIDLQTAQELIKKMYDAAVNGSRISQNLGSIEPEQFVAFLMAELTREQVQKLLEEVDAVKKQEEKLSNSARTGGGASAPGAPASGATSGSGEPSGPQPPNNAPATLKYFRLPQNIEFWGKSAGGNIKICNTSETVAKDDKTVYAFLTSLDCVAHYLNTLSSTLGAGGDSDPLYRALAFYATEQPMDEPLSASQILDNDQIDNFNSHIKGYADLYVAAINTYAAAVKGLIDTSPVSSPAQIKRGGKIVEINTAMDTFQNFTDTITKDARDRYRVDLANALNRFRVAAFCTAAVAAMNNQAGPDLRAPIGSIDPGRKANGEVYPAAASMKLVEHKDSSGDKDLNAYNSVTDEKAFKFFNYTFYNVDFPSGSWISGPDDAEKAKYVEDTFKMLAERMNECMNSDQMTPLTFRLDTGDHAVRDNVTPPPAPAQGTTINWSSLQRIGYNVLRSFSVKMSDPLAVMAYSEPTCPGYSCFEPWSLSHNGVPVQTPPPVATGVRGAQAQAASENKSFNGVAQYMSAGYLAAGGVAGGFAGVLSPALAANLLTVLLVLLFTAFLGLLAVQLSVLLVGAAILFYYTLAAYFQIARARPDEAVAKLLTGAVGIISMIIVSGALGWMSRTFFSYVLFGG